MNIRLNIPEEFFREEEKCGYTVSAEMKKVWAVALDLLNEFDKVCRENNLNYFIAYGTLLGAIRHGGFIPWDDDVDLVMPRNDYDRLCAMADENFRPPYFFQTEKTDPGFSRPFARLRNSETTAFQKIEDYKKISYNQGIFIDIFPMDSFPDAESDQKRFKEELMKAKRRMLRFSRFTTRSKRQEAHSVGDHMKNMVKGCSSLLTRRLLRTFRIGNPFVAEFEKLEQRYRGTMTDSCCVPFFFNPQRQIIWKKSCFNGTVSAAFEMLTVPAPSGYEEILSTCYGNWQVPERKNTVHGDVFFDADHSYRDYLNASRKPSF